MVFASPIFLTLFLPIVLLGYFLTPKKFKNIFLLIASILFYSWGAPKFIFAILLTTTIDFYLAKLIDSSMNERRRKTALWISISMNVGFLFYFKYFNFFIDTVNSVLSHSGSYEIKALQVMLPIGISFYTFESITYLVDVYRKVHKPLRNFWDYQLYILFFPKLIAGPITRYHEIADQLTDRFETDNSNNIISGFIRFCLGLGKKVLIANTLGQFATAVYDTPLKDMDSTIAWSGALAYTFQIYFDFSGYSDMALGLAKIFGFSLPENFNNPYTAGSITEFWRRWHMTLGNWMKNYIYIPLGGNRVPSKTKLYLNLFLIFIISGFWHGASWNFLLWGLVHGLFIVVERLFLLNTLQKIPKAFSVLYMFIIVNFAWVLFRSNSFEQTAVLWRSMVNFNFIALDISPDLKLYYLLATVFSFITLFSFGKKLEAYFYAPRFTVISITLLVGISMALFTICLASVFGSDFNPFIYFRF